MLGTAHGTSQSPIDRVNLSEVVPCPGFQKGYPKSQSPIGRVNLSEVESDVTTADTVKARMSQSPIDRVNLSEVPVIVRQPIAGSHVAIPY